MKKILSYCYLSPLKIVEIDSGCKVHNVHNIIFFLEYMYLTVLLQTGMWQFLMKVVKRNYPVPIITWSFGMVIVSLS